MKRCLWGNTKSGAVCDAIRMHNAWSTETLSLGSMREFADVLGLHLQCRPAQNSQSLLLPNRGIVWKSLNSVWYFWNDWFISLGLFRTRKLRSKKYIYIYICLGKSIKQLKLRYPMIAKDHHRHIIPSSKLYVILSKTCWFPFKACLLLNFTRMQLYNHVYKQKP